MDKQELIDYLAAKNEALDFWRALRKVVPVEKKITLLEREIAEAKKELKAIRLSEKLYDKLLHRSITDGPLRRMNRLWDDQEHVSMFEGVHR
jgi:hypothetical protein